jgi:hypothetical protein
VLTEGSVGLEGRAKVSATLTGGEGAAKLGDRVGAGRLQLLDPTALLGMVLRRYCRGQGGGKHAGGKELRRRIDFTCGGVGLNSGHGKSWGRGYPARGAP